MSDSLVEQSSEAGAQTQTQQTQEEPKFFPNDIVLAKISGYKPWPSIVCPEAKLPSNILARKPKAKKISYPVFFLSDGTFSWCNEQQLTRFDDAVGAKFKKDESKLKGVYKQSFELAITKPTCDEVLPVYVEPPAVEIAAEAVETAQQARSKKKKRAPPAKKNGAAAAANKKQKLDSPSPAPVAGKRKNKPAVIIESSSEEEEEEEDEEEEEEEEVKQSFIPELDSKTIAETIKKNTKQVLQLRLDLQTELLSPAFLEDIDVTDEQSKADLFVKHVSKQANLTALNNRLDSVVKLAADHDNFILLKKYKIFKVLYLAAAKPEWAALPKVSKKFNEVLTKFDFESEEVGVVDENWGFDYNGDDKPEEEQPQHDGAAAQAEGSPVEVKVEDTKINNGD